MSVLNFSIILSATEIPREQSQEQNHWAEAPVAHHITVVGHHRI